mmetsp:Transcript_28325/g.47618  ORF Transcript_28325/g.47618 Transcript_28325/m.47618 type:complete len:303 (+) Transcript_28325:37-945(+)
MMKYVICVAFIMVRCTWALSILSNLKTLASNSSIKPLWPITTTGSTSMAKLTLLRGGHRVFEDALAPIIIDRVSDACGVLALIKIPAALFAGASLSALYISDTKESDPKLRFTYVIFTAMAFALHVCTVFCSTVLSWRLVGGGFDPNAESGAALMLKYFPFEYLSVGTFFFGGIFSFFLANTVRAHISFGCTREAMACSIINSISTFFLLNFFDIAMVYFDNFGQFLGSFITLGWQKITSFKLSPTILAYFVVAIGTNILVGHQSAMFAKRAGGAESKAAAAAAAAVTNNSGSTSSSPETAE